jgi:hypothetical protein
MDHMRWLWHIVRLPILLLLAILEPVVAFVCGGLALLGLLAVGFFELAAVPRFPLGTMLAISIGFACFLALYEGAIRLLSE